MSKPSKKMIVMKTQRMVRESLLPLEPPPPRAPMLPPWSPRELGLVIEALRDKLVVLDGITRRSKHVACAERASDYRVILDRLKEAAR